MGSLAAILLPIGIDLLGKALPHIMAWMSKKDNTDWFSNLLSGSGASSLDLGSLLSGLSGGGSNGSSDEAAQLKRIADALEALLPKVPTQPVA